MVSRISVPSLTIILTLAGCASPAVLYETLAAPKMGAVQHTPLPILAERNGEATTEPPTEAQVTQSTGRETGNTTDQMWDTALAAPGLPRAGRVERSADGWRGPGGLGAALVGDFTFFSNGTWMRRNGDTFQHSGGGTTVKRGDTFFHSDGTWARRVGNVVMRSDGHSCALTETAMVCP